MVIMIPITSLFCITLSFPVCVDKVEAWERLEDHRTQANMRKDCAVHHCMGGMGMARPPCGLNLDQSHFAEGQLTSRGSLICNALSLFAALSSFSSPCLIFISHCSYLRNSVSLSLSSFPTNISVCSLCFFFHPPTQQLEFL